MIGLYARVSQQRNLVSFNKWKPNDKACAYWRRQSFSYLKGLPEPVADENGAVCAFFMPQNIKLWTTNSSSSALRN